VNTTLPQPGDESPYPGARWAGPLGVYEYTAHGVTSIAIVTTDGLVALLSAEEAHRHVINVLALANAADAARHPAPTASSNAAAAGWDGPR
jgi:hypothetical protein